MSSFTTTVSKESLSFSSGHFITYGGGLCETLHGHNYRAGVTVCGQPDEHGLVVDFVWLKAEMEALIRPLDHKMLLPGRNRALKIVTKAGEVRVEHGDKRYLFPREDVTLLPLANTTAELLAEYLCDQLRSRLTEAGVKRLAQLEVEVEESFGQSGSCTQVLEHG